MVGKLRLLRRHRLPDSAVEGALLELVAEHRRLRRLEARGTEDVGAGPDVRAALQGVEERFEELLRRGVSHRLVQDAWRTYLRGRGSMPEA